MGRGDARPARARTAYVDRLVVDPATATDELLALIERGRVTPEEAIVRVLAGAAAEAGERWQRAEWDRTSVHVATVAVEEAAYAVARVHAPRGRRRGHVVVTTAVGEAHELPAKLFRSALRVRGRAADFLPATLGTAHLADHLANAAPVALLVCCTQRARLPGIAPVVEAAHRAGVPAVAGGAAFGDSARRAAALGADGWAASVEGVEQVLATPRAPRRTARQAEEPPFAGRRDLLAEAWRAELRAQHDPARAEWLGEYVPLVLGSYEAAAVTGDDSVLIEDLAWLARATGARFADPDLVPSMLAPLLRLLPPADVATHRLFALAVERLDGEPHPAVAGIRRDTPRVGHPAATTGREPAFDELAFVASVLCGCAYAAISVCDAGRLVVKGAHGIDAGDYDSPDLGPDDAFADDARTDPRLAAHPLVTGYGAASVGRVVLRNAEAHPCGELVVGDPAVRAATPRQRRALRALARHVEDRLAGAVTPDESTRAEATMLRTSEVAALFHVSPRTVNNWVAGGRLEAVTTAGGHKRFRYADVHALYRATLDTPRS